MEETMQISSVVFVKDLDVPTSDIIALGEIMGPWDSEDAAVDEVLLDGQKYRVKDGVLYALPLEAHD
jgi:hypothetical protein